MDVRRFLEENRGSWKQLEHLLDQVDQLGLRALEPNQVIELGQLYRKACSDLLLSRKTGARPEVSDYLETVVGRAYSTVYAAPRLHWRNALRKLVQDWPRRLAREQRYVLTAAMVFGLGWVAAFGMTSADPAAFEQLVPAEYAAVYSTAPDDYRSERFGDMKDSQAAAFSSMLMVNNIRVALRAFVLGLTFGIGTLAVLFSNGILLGAIAANFTRWGLDLEFWALILPHGVVEIFAIVVAGGAGLILADALVRPGRRSRLEALQARGRDALSLSAMAIPFLVLAGVIEGYVTPAAWLSYEAKLVFASLVTVALVAWIVSGRRGMAQAPSRSDTKPLSSAP